MGGNWVDFRGYQDREMSTHDGGATMNRTITSLAAVALLALSPGASLAQSDKPDATIDYSGGSVAVGIGYSWGQGVLHFKGKDYPFTVNGLDVVNVGASSIKATGQVYHLTKVSDFPGNYTAATAGATVAGGAAATAMKNQNGVVMELTATTQGLQFTLAPAGIAVALEGGAPATTGSSSSK
jgi:hypothetical protein